MDEQDIEGLLCDPDRLGTVLQLPPNTTLSATNISMSVCGLDRARAAPIAETLIENLQIGNLIKEVSRLLGQVVQF